MRRSRLSHRLALGSVLRREGRTSDLLRREDFVEEDEEAEQVGEVAADAEDVLRSSAAHRFRANRARASRA